MARRPNWTANRRNELAAEKLQALGVEWRGSPYAAWRKLSVQQRAEGVRQLVQRRIGYHGGGKNVGPPTRKRRQVEKRIGEVGRVVETTSPARIMSALKEGVRRRERVAIYLIFPTDNGPRTHVIGSQQTKGYNRFQKEDSPPRTEERPMKVQLVFAPQRNMPGGILPARVIELCDRIGVMEAMRRLYDIGEAAL